MLDQHYTYSIVTEPESEPLAPGEVQQHLLTEGCSCAGEEAQKNALITVARQHVEQYTQRVLLETVMRLSLDQYPLGNRWGSCGDIEWYRGSSSLNRDRIIYLTRGPIQSVESITYVDTNGATQTLATSKYQTDLISTPSRIAEAYNESWPDTRTEALNAVVVNFTAGYADAASVPAPFKHAMLLLVGHYWQNREAAIAGQLYDIPFGVRCLLDPYRIGTGVG